MSDEISYSRISTWKRCLKKYFYKYVEGLKPKSKPAPPRMGSMGHKGLEAKWRGEDWKQAVEDYWRQEIKSMPDAMIKDEHKEELDLVIKVLERYFDYHDHFRHPDERDLIEPETKFKIKIPYTNKYLIGYMDKVIEVPNEGIWLVDHKFTTNKLDKKLEKLELNEQIDYYTWALSKMFPNKKIMGAIWNGIRLKLPTVPEPIKSGKRLTKRKMTTDYETYYQAIIDNGFDPEDYQERLQKLKNQDNPFFRTSWCDRFKQEIENIEKELVQCAIGIEKTAFDIRSRAMGRCSWDCNYSDLCLAEKKDGDLETIIDENYEYYEREDDEEKQENGKELAF